jgi:hypothetical protein
VFTQPIYFDDGVPRNEAGEPILTHTGEGVITAEYLYQKLYNGEMYHINGNASVNTGDVVAFVGCTNNDTDIHFINFEIIASATPILIEFYESPTITSNGTLIPNTYMNRNINNTGSLDVYGGSTITDDGTLLFRKAILGTQNKDVGSFEEIVGWFLKYNTCYQFKITNNDGNNVDLYANFYWYEESR